MTGFDTLNDALAARRDSVRGIDFIEGGNDDRRLPFRDLRDRALGLLRHFQACGAKPGSEMLLLVDSNQQFIDAFWAGVLGGIAVVPVAPGANDEHRNKFFRILQQLANPLLCTDSRVFSRYADFASAAGLTADIESLKPHTVLLDRIDDISRPGSPYTPAPDDIAFIQYSSGSTSEPKGVVLSHRNLLTNIRAIARGINLTDNDVGLSWMPLTHDMGLIGFHLTLLVADASHGLMPTALFVRRPQLWLAKAGEMRATLLCSPNFGYKHFLRTFTPEKAAQLDLSAVRLLFNGAEPISTALCEEFLTALAPSGLKRTVMFPVYGLAEASLAVAFPEPEIPYHTVMVRRETLNTGARVEIAESSDDVAFACVGRPVEGCAVRIADDDGQEVTPGVIGRILIRGDNVTHGYYRNPEATRAALSDDGWLDTGDLGFIADAGLVISGRRKEILFVNGQNYYPQDIEAVLERHAGVELGKAAACGVRPPDAETDRVLVFVLHRGDPASFIPVVKAVRKCVNEQVGIVVDHVIPVGRIPKTTSGKIQRYLLAQQYQAGEFNQSIAQLNALMAQDVTAESEQQDEVARALKEICDALITGKPVGLHDNIFELGTSSLTLAQIHQRIETVYPGKLQVTDFFDYPTISDLAGYLRKQSAGRT
ncbi:MAG TPA: AMP-binding protein [Burkholderiales bacterium]|nr:AMP-binding protein [Burkholderiales bacterium]